MISEKVFGKTASGYEVKEYILDNGNIKAHILNYGGIINKLFVRDKNGEMRDVVLGYDDVYGYESNGGYLGAFIGRVANRIKGGEFTLNGEKYKLYQNDGVNSLHGGKNGFDKKIFDVQIEDDKLVLSALSPDGEEGYPGNMNIKVIYSLEGSAINLCYECTSDKDTPVSLTNHSYFNLSGEQTILDHVLTVNADFITPIDKELIPTGELMVVEGTPFDFKNGTKIGQYIDYPHTQIKHGGGYDHNFVLKNYNKYEKVANLYCEKSGISMDVYTDNFGVQVYSGNFLDGVKGKNGVVYGKRGAVCLETQNFPNAINQLSFPSAVLKAGGTFKRKTTYDFSVVK